MGESMGNRQKAMVEASGSKYWVVEESIGAGYFNVLTVSGNVEDACEVFEAFTAHKATASAHIVVQESKNQWHVAVRIEKKHVTICRCKSQITAFRVRDQLDNTL